MAQKFFAWAYPAVALLVSCSLTGAEMRPCCGHNETLKNSTPSVQSEVAANDPNTPDPEGGVPTLSSARAF